MAMAATLSENRYPPFPCVAAATLAGALGGGAGNPPAEHRQTASLVEPRVGRATILRQPGDARDRNLFRARYPPRSACTAVAAAGHHPSPTGQTFSLPCSTCGSIPMPPR